jgi:hypothetical protein
MRSEPTPFENELPQTRPEWRTQLPSNLPQMVEVVSPNSLPDVGVILAVGLGAIAVTGLSPSWS